MQKEKLLNALKIIAIPVVFALAMQYFYGTNLWKDLYSIMSLTFLVCLPIIIGALTVYFSKIESLEKISYLIFAPWVPIFVFFFVTILLRIEGFACWLMMMPFFLVAASVGGLIGGYLKIKNNKDKLQMSVLVLLPFVLSPIESMIGSIPGTYTAYTEIDVQGTATQIWPQILRVEEIPEAQDHSRLTKIMGFPRPIKAVLNYEGVGAYREAIFSGGLIFHETVLEYADKQKMVFSIKANPHEIPSTTMDEHVVIGGDYFDVLNGTYELEQLNDHTTRIHLYSHFKLTTTFNFYASWWARWIMQDIQNNILEVIKDRVEGGRATDR
jgi:hypothetical protein